MKLLEKLIMTHGVPGREYRLRELIKAEAGDLFDEMHEDAMGSLIGVRKPRPAKGAKPPRTPTKVMLAAHMDQIGFLVRHIDDKGFVRLNPVGGFDPRNLFARFVTICPDVRNPKKDLHGVMNPAGKPVHIASEADKTKVPDVMEFIVDLGLPGDEVKQRVKIGDMVVIRPTFDELGNTIVAQALDNRVACWIAIEGLRKLKHHAAEIHCVFTVQEEVGLRGATTSSFNIQPDIGIAIDTTLCCDTPGVPEDMAITKQGEGVGLTVMDSASIADLDLLEEFEAVAKKHKIPHQRSILPRGGTDSGAIQRSGRGARTFTLSCGTRYIHTVTEMIHKVDLHASRDLLAAWLEQVK